MADICRTFKVRKLVGNILFSEEGFMEAIEPFTFPSRSVPCAGNALDQTVASDQSQYSGQ